MNNVTTIAKSVQLSPAATLPAKTVPAQNFPAVNFQVPVGVVVDLDAIVTEDHPGQVLYWIFQGKKIPIMGGGAAVAYDPGWSATEASAAVKAILGVA